MENSTQKPTFYIRRRIMHKQENQILSYHAELSVAVEEFRKLMNKIQRDGEKVIAKGEDSALSFGKDGKMYGYAIQISRTNNYSKNAV